MRNKILEKTAESLYIFLTTSDEVEKYFEMMQSSSFDNCICHFDIKILNFFGPDLQLINTKPIMKNKLKELLCQLKKFTVQTILVLEYKKKKKKKITKSSI